MSDTGDPKQEKKFELSMEIRLLIAFALMGLVLFVTPMFYGPPKPGPKKDTPAAQTQPAQVPPAAAAAPAKPAERPSAKPAAVVSGGADQTIVVETDLYKVTFSNRGAVIHNWQLKKYMDATGKPVDVADRPAEAVQKAGWPLCYLDFKGRQVTKDLNQALFAVKQPDPLVLEFEFSDGKTTARKTFHFSKNKYNLQFLSEVKLEGELVPHRLAWRGGFGDRTVLGAAGSEHAVYYETKLVVNAAKDAENGPVSAMGALSFAGLEDTYFAGVLLPPAGSNLELQTWRDAWATPPENKEEAHVGVALAGEGRLEGTLFVGPKDLDALRSTDRKLEQMIDFGWFWFIAKPLFLAMHWVSDNLIANWGWSIVFVTIIINFLMLPLRFSSLRSQRKMQKIQPEINLINAKYKGLSMRDPKKQKQQEEMMALYSKHGINPAGGCVPMLLQMPFFFAFYKVLTVVIELRGASWLWVLDLSQPEPGFLRWLPILMLITQVVMQKMTPATPGADPNQMRMMYLMPLVLFIPFYQASAGLVLYWLTGNVVGIIQQFFFNKAAAAHPAAPAAASEKKKGK